MRQDVASYLQQAVCVRRNKTIKKKKTEKSPAPPKAHHETHISLATATNSRRRATKHVPRVSPYPPASIDAGLMEISNSNSSYLSALNNYPKIGLVQLSQSVKTTNVTHTHTDLLNNGTLYAPRY